MPTTQQFFWVGLPVFAGFVALEFVILWRQGRAYSWKAEAPIDAAAERQAVRLT